MAYTYAGNPGASLVDETHYRLGNTNPAAPIATDEECAFALREHGNNTYLAAASIAENKAMEFVNRPSTVKKGDRTTSYMFQAESYLALARQLRLNATIASAQPYFGGSSVGEHESDARDRSLTQPFATKHLHEQGHARSHIPWPDGEARE